MEFYVLMKQTKRYGVLGPVDMKGEKKKQLINCEGDLLQQRKNNNRNL